MDPRIFLFVLFGLGLLLAIAMPLTVAAVALLGWWALGLAPPTAILLDTALAPTDPVLARSVQVGLPLIGKLAVAFLGIPGMGSLYYLSYGQNHGDFTGIDQLWAVVCFTILASIVIHGVTSARFLAHVEAHGAHIHFGEHPEMAALSPSDRKRIELADRPSA